MILTGTNISYYPDGCVYIATDHWEGAKEYLDQNFKEEEEEPRITFDRCVKLVYSLSSRSNLETMYH